MGIYNRNKRRKQSASKGNRTTVRKEEPPETKRESIRAPKKGSFPLDEQ